MKHPRVSLLPVLAILLFLAGCASRPVNPPIAEVNRNSGYRFATCQLYDSDKENLVILAFSGGSFTALAYGLYGDKLFDDYERRFLKRNVQGDLRSRFLNPTHWSALWSNGWGRSEMAAQMYDEFLFDGATFGDLDRGDGPLILAMATDISTGSRFTFVQSEFDMICSDLDSVPLARAAAGKIILNSPEFQRLLTDTGAVVVPPPGAALPAAQ